MTDLNITAIGQNEGLGQLFCIVNSSADGLLIGGFLIALFFIMLLVLKKWDFDKALLSSSWSCFLISLIPAATTCYDGSRMLSPYYSLVFLLIAALTGLYVFAVSEG